MSSKATTLRYHILLVKKSKLKHNALISEDFDQVILRLNERISFVI